jgi:hypothetical protein
LARATQRDYIKREFRRWYACSVLSAEMTINQKERNHGKPIFAED